MEVVAACVCLCKGKGELTSSAGTGCLLFWSLSVTFYFWSLCGEAFWRDKPDGVKALLWPVGPTWGNAGLCSPSCLSCLFSVWLHPGAPRCECQCRVSSPQTDALCSLRTTLTWASITRNQDKPERSDGFLSAKTKFRTFINHQLSCSCCLYLLSLITLLVFTCKQLLSPLYVPDSRQGSNIALKEHFEDILLPSFYAFPVESQFDLMGDDVSART